MRNGKVALTALATALLMAACGGEAGPAGASSIIETVNESAGENCAQGGITIRTGVDADGDGTLSDTEVDSTSYVCNGDQGEQGDQGNKLSLIHI